MSLSSMRSYCVLTILALGPSIFVGEPARADDVVLEDSGSYTWDIDADGYGHVIEGTDNAYDLWPDLCIRSGPQDESCATSEVYHVSSNAGLDMDGRQIVMSSLTLGPVSVRRKIFVPSQGTAFARFMEILYNPAFHPVVVNVRLGTVGTTGAALGSGDDTIISATFDKDTTLEPGDDWWCTDDTLDGQGTPALAHVIQGAGGRVSASALVSDAFGNGPGAIYWEYQNVTIAARDTVILLHFESQAPSRAFAEDTARWIHDAPVDILAGMTSEEVLEVVNWDLEFVPTADAGGPYSGDEGSPVALDATESTDPNGNIASYAWDCTNDGTVDVTSTAPTGSTCTYPDQGDYTLALTVTDATGFTAHDTTSVTVVNVAPSIDQLNVPSSGLEGQGLSFSATVSDPGTTDRLTYLWDFGDGNTSTSPAPTKAYVDEGTFVVTLTVSDGDGGSAEASATIEIANVAPTIDILNIPALGNEGETLPFSTFVSDPGSSDTLSFEWDFGDGTVQSGIDLTALNHTFAEEGNYTVVLTVSDGDGGEASGQGTIIVNNVAPVITYVDSPSSADEGENLSFHVEADDPGGDPLSYRWTFGDGVSATGAAVSHAFADDGSYDVVVTVSDDDGASSSATIQVLVANVAPSVQSVNAPTTSDEGTPVTFSANATDPGDDTLTYRWDFGDGASAEGAQVSHTYSDDGTFDLLLTVSDDDGGETAATGSIEVFNVAPTIETLTAPSTGNQGQSLEFSAIATDPGNDTLTFTWDFGDGTGESDVDLTDVTHAYTAPGAYDLVLTVSDEDGGESSSSRTVNIDNGAPGISSLTAPSSALEGDTVELSVIAEDPGGDPLVYTWEFGDDSAPVTGDDLHTVSHLYIDQGDYAIQVTVTDPGGLEAVAGRTIHVENAPPSIVDTSIPENALEGETFTVTATVEDPGADDVVTTTWDFGDETPLANGTPVSHVYTQNGNYQITLLVQDEDGGSTLDTFSISVTNVAPSILSLQGPETLDEGEEGTWTASVEDPGADTLTYNWSFGDGETATGATATHAYHREGKYPIALTVTDQDGASDIASTSVSVANLPPSISSVTIPNEGDEGEELTFAVVAADPGGDPVSVQWTFGDGNGASAAETSHAYPDNGTFEVAVVVTDQSGAETTATGTVVVSNLPPQASPPSAPETAGEGELIEVLATFSDPGTADTLSASLIWGDGTSSPAVSGEPVAHTYADDGSYNLRIKVADDDGALVTSDATGIEIYNLPPAIERFDGPKSAQVGQTLTFSAVATDPGPEDVLTYTYDWGDGTDPDTGTNLSNAEHQFTSSDSFTVTLTVSDGDGGSDSDSLTVIVEVAAPSIDSWEVPAQADEAQPVTFSAQGEDPTGQALTYTWSFGDGSDVLEGPDLTNVTHAFPDNGVYTVSLTVTDTDDLSAYQSSTITIVNLPPVIVSAPPPDYALEGDTYTYQVVAQDPAGDSDPLQYALDAGPDGMVLSETGLVTWIPSLSQAEAGTVSFTVRVSDDDGGVATESATIVVDFIDQDDDGMPDTWELEHGLDPSQDDSAGDLDQDGITNLDEYLSGSAPDTSNAPSAPEILSPPDGSEVDELPVLLEVENSEDIDGDTLTYGFELYQDASLTTLLAAARKIPEQPDSTAWQPPIPLAENHPYWWRARANDGTVYGPWSAVAEFRVNVENDPPGQPVPNSPADGAVLSTSQPQLEVINATDPDGSRLTYTFEVYDMDLTLVDRAEGLLEEDDGTTAWQVSVPLTPETTYFWHARATDPQGVDGPWSDDVGFTIQHGNTPPSQPTILSPEPGSRVDTDRPLLTVANAVDPDGDTLDYFFEIDQVSTFDSAGLQTSGPVSEGTDGETSWQVRKPLEENVEYTWRVSADDGWSASSWATATFRVDTVNEPPGVPTLQNPSDGSVVPSGPLTLSLVPTTDPDGDTLTYTFIIRTPDGEEVFRDSDVPAGVEKLVSTELTTDELPTDSDAFAWTAFAQDDRGLAGDEAVPNAFQVVRDQTPTPSISPPQGDDDTAGPEGTPTETSGSCNCDTRGSQHPGSTGAIALLVSLAVVMSRRRSSPR